MYFSRFLVRETFKCVLMGWSSPNLQPEPPCWLRSPLKQTGSGFLQNRFASNAASDPLPVKSANLSAGFSFILSSLLYMKTDSNVEGLNSSGSSLQILIGSGEPSSEQADPFCSPELLSYQDFSSEQNISDPNDPHQDMQISWEDLEQLVLNLLADSRSVRNFLWLTNRTSCCRLAAAVTANYREFIQSMSQHSACSFY